MAHKSIKLLSAFLSFVMVFGILATVPFTAYAAETTQSEEKLNTYKTESSTLAPGVTQTINYAYRDDGKYVKYYVAVADLSDPNVGLQATYGGAQCTDVYVSKMSEQVKAMTELHTNPNDTDNYIENYAIVAGVNGDGYNVGSGKPSGAHVMNGVSGFNIVKSGNSPWFALFEDGTVACGRNNTDWDAAVAAHGAVKEAIGGFQLLMKDGVVWEPSANANDMTKGGDDYWRPGFDYPCSFLGVTYDNKLVLLNCDGNNAGGSAGFDYDYTLEVAQELGLKDLLCLDGGGSATYLSRPEGENEVVVISNPSDGSERAVANGLVIYTTTPPSDVFDRAVLETSNTYYTPYSEVVIEAQGVSPAGTPAEVPMDDVEWAISDTSLGSISNDGVFVSNGKTGTVSVQMLLDEKVVGETEFQIVNPTSVAFTHDTMVVPFGKTAAVKMEASYKDVDNITYSVEIKASDFNFAFSDAAAGTLNGFDLTATTDESKSGVTLTATYKHAQLGSISIEVEYGKASEIVWNFEDGDISNWLGNADLLEWIKENGLEATSPATSLHGASTLYDDGSFKQYGGNTWNTNKISTFLATAENGQVKNGNYALGVTVDSTHYSGPGNWNYTMFFNVEGQTVLRDVANGKNATSIGMWVYLPEDLIGTRYKGDQAGYAMQITFYGGTSAETVNGVQAPLYAQDTGKSLYDYKNDDRTATEVGRWVYMSADISGYNYVSLQNPKNNIYKEPSFIRFYTKRLEPKKYTFYYDDITLDYSSAVEDRDAPIISNPKYVVVDNAIDFSNVCTQNKVLLKANIAEFSASNASGLDYSSAKIYVDGVKLNKVTASGNTMTSDEITLTNGTHEIIFEIADNMGTITRNSEMLTISGTAPVWVTGHNDSGKPAEYDSVYYMDLKVAEAADISKIVTEVRLNDANTWELPYLTVTDGFTVDYELCELTNTVKFTVTKNADCTLTGEQILVSVPVRIWSWDETLYLPKLYNVEPDYLTVEDLWTISDLKAAKPIVPIDFEVEYGVVTYVEEKYDGYLGNFYSFFTTETNLQDDKYRWHSDHTATAMDDVDATCTKDGYTGRTYCDVCKSVVDWGTIRPATGHDFAVVEGVLKCACGELFNGVYTDGKTYVDGVVMANGWNVDSYYKDGVKLTGVQLIDGYYYDFGDDGVCAGKTKYTGKFYNEAANGYSYAIAGELQNGWYLVDGIWNYFRWTEKTAITGTYTFQSGACAGITYVFDDEGNLTDGVWHTREDGNIQYFYGPDCYHWANNMLQEIDGKTYCFDQNGYLYRGWQMVKIGAFAPYHLYHFNDVTGELYHAYEDDTGIVLTGENGYYLVDGIVQNGLGMITVDGAQYYVRGNGLLALGKFYIGAGYTGCGHLTPGYYDFGEDGKFVGTWVDKSLNGVQKGEDGELHYYVNGVVQKSLGMITIDGANYYVRGNGLIAVGKYYIGAGYTGCNHLTPGYYDFGEDGKFVGTWVDKSLNGVQKGEDGELHYYVNGVVQKSLGMITIDGANYYVRGNGLLAVGKYYIGAGYTGCGHLTPGYYDFGEDGKFVGAWEEPVDPDSFTGVKVGEDGNLHYYVNDVIQKSLGMITIDGFNYYVRGNGILAAGKYYIGAGYTGCGHLTPGYYNFGEDGKFVGPWVDLSLNGVQTGDDGYLHYYVNGEIQKSLGMITIDGANYYVRGNGLLAVGKYYIGAGYTGCGHLTPGYYDFGEDGKFVGPWTE